MYIYVYIYIYVHICVYIYIYICMYICGGGFPSRFSKHCFHSFILSCWFAAFSFALAVFFESITRIISKQLDIKLGPFTQEELNSVLRKIKNRKAAGLDEIPPEVWKTRQFDDILFRHCNAVYNQNPIDR